MSTHPTTSTDAETDSQTTEADHGGETVTIPVAPPREPAAYRATDHFRNRLRERVDEHRRGSLPAELIREGRVRRAPRERRRRSRARTRRGRSRWSP